MVMRVIGVRLGGSADSLLKWSRKCNKRVKYDIILRKEWWISLLERIKTGSNMTFRF